MTDTQGGTPTDASPPIQQIEFERISNIVSSNFQVEEALIEHSIPTYRLKEDQETKQAFLKLLKILQSQNMIALLRREGSRIVLRVLPKPRVKPYNVIVNWALFFATIVTTFITGYILSENMLDPLIGGLSFTVAIMAVLGLHEMGHKVTANRGGVEATPPYFIPGPPPFGGVLGVGTFGAVIMQKSLPANKDSLFDIGANGPLVGFFVAVIVSAVGLILSPIVLPDPNEASLPVPLLFDLFAIFLIKLPAGYAIRLHPIAFAGWVGLIVTMLNLLPAAMLDGGHVATALLSERVKLVLTSLSIVFLVVTGFWPMAGLVLFFSFYRHPGPLDSVSSLSTRRKIVAAGLVAVFVLSSFVHLLVLELLSLFF
jgi:membrane-associated protease RseP (regulator of RpoE activity)